MHVPDKFRKNGAILTKCIKNNTNVLKTVNSINILFFLTLAM